MTYDGVGFISRIEGNMDASLYCQNPKSDLQIVRFKKLPKNRKKLKPVSGNLSGFKIKVIYQLIYQLLIN